MGQQENFLTLFHPLTAAWGGSCWGTWSVALKALAPSSRSRIWLAPALWILLEQFEALSYFDYTWGWLGYALHGCYLENSVLDLVHHKFTFFQLFSRSVHEDHAVVSCVERVCKVIEGSCPVLITRVRDRRSTTV